MPTLLRLKTAVRISGLVDGDHGAQLRPLLNQEISWTDGDQADQVNRAAQRLNQTLTDSENNLELRQNDTDFEGTVIGISNARIVAVKNTGDNELFLTLQGGDAGELFSLGDGVTVNPGGIALMINPSANGWTISDVGDAIRVASDLGETITYDLLVMGS
ncbi:MAG: hypothetical protein AAFV53_16545 [Myxococcota bacterium]